MATRGKRSHKKTSARKAGRTARRKDTRGRKAAAAIARPRRARASGLPAGARPRSNGAAARVGAAVRSAAPIVRRSVRPISSGWSTLRVVWRPAISMATLPYRVYRVYRWAEAESSRAFAATPAP